MKVKISKSKLKITTMQIKVNEKICRDRIGNPMCSYPVSYEYYAEMDSNRSCDWFGTKGRFYKIIKE